MADRSDRTGRRRTEGKKSKSAARVTKKLGAKAQAAIAHNDEDAEAFIYAVENPGNIRVSRAVRRQKLGAVTAVVGNYVFKVKSEGMTFDASLRGLLRGGHGLAHNPEATTGVRVGSYVVLDGEEIVAVLTGGQASRARRALGMRSASGRSSSGGIRFARSSEERKDAAHRAALLAGLNRGRRGSSSSHRRRSSSGRRSSSKRNRSWFSFW